jgi:serine/threonine protein kinase
VVAGLGLELVAALQALHDAGIVHCDVKPANLVVDQDGGLVLVDLGIAELDGKGPAHPARQRGEVVGSPVYMAPELILGRPPRAAADLWSLGVTLYTAVEGRPPFPQGDPLPTLAAVLRDPPLPMRRAGRLHSILKRLLVKVPENRPRHEELRALLVGVRSSPPAAAMALGIAYVREPDRAGRYDADTLPFVA